jgi:1-acyl-sn-glycerol-3-phosphate acyltransferase
MLDRLRATVAHRVVWVLGAGVFRFRIEIAGRERIPPGEPLIVAGAPHRNWIDGFLLLMALPPEPRVIFLGSEGGLFNTWWKRAVLAAIGGFEPVSATSALNRAALDGAVAVLARGDRLGIFPEGWDNLDAPPDTLPPLRRGAAYIARESGRRVLPVALAGAKPLWRGKTLRVRIGDPIVPPPPDADRPTQQAWTDALRGALQALIPPQPPEPADGRKPWPWLTTLLD